MHAEAHAEVSYLFVCVSCNTDPPRRRMELLDAVNISVKPKQERTSGFVVVVVFCATVA